MRRIRSLPFALLLLSLAASAGLVRQPERILVTGSVVDSVSGHPLFGVAVATTTTPDHTASDSAGAFTLSVPAGTAVMLTFSGSGFETVGQVVTSTRDVDLGRVALLPRAVALAPIEVSVSQLDQRARGFTGNVFVYNEATLRHSGESDMLDFVMHHGGLHPHPCNLVDTTPMTECFRVRGYAARPQLYVNEVRLGQLSQLRVYRPEDIARVEVFSGGAMIRVYTRPYLEQLARAGRRLQPISRF
jgi:hypothetical protein